MSGPDEQLLTLEPASAPTTENQPPHVIAFVNHLSGSGKGDSLITILVEQLGQDNIFIFGRDDPRVVLFREQSKGSDVRVIVCGGDGSVNWIMSIIDHLGIHNMSIGIIPNGTGNDTSNYLGWGKRQFGEARTRANIQLMCNPTCPITQFDRWQVYFSVKKQDMFDRTALLYKNREVPMSHLHVIREPRTFPHTELSRTKNTNISSSGAGSNTAPSDDQSTGITNTTTAATATPATTTPATTAAAPVIGEEEFLFPKFYRCMLRQTELEYLERYKGLHEQHWPEEYTPYICELDSSNNYQRRPNPQAFIDGIVPSSLLEHDIQRGLWQELLNKRSRWFHFTWSFNNYFSFGVDAQVMNDFAIHRDNNPQCYKCRCCTMTWIGLCGLSTCCQCKKKPLRYRVDILYKQGDLTPIDAIERSNLGLDSRHDVIEVHSLGTQQQQQQQQDGGTGTAAEAEADLPIQIEQDTAHSQPPHASSQEDALVPLRDTHEPGTNSTNNQPRGSNTLINATPQQLAERTLYGPVESPLWATDKERQYLTDPYHLTPDFHWLEATFDADQFGALVLLNIPSYAGGCNPWGNKAQSHTWLAEQNAQSTEDGKLETCALKGFLHMNTIVSFKGQAYRLAQSRGLRIYMENDGFIQLDGEAWIQPRGIIEIFRAQSGRMLRNIDPQYPPC